MAKNIIIFSDGTGQAGGFRFDEVRSNVYQVDTDGIDAGKDGTDWTADEIAVLVGSYFRMLAEERAGRLLVGKFDPAARDERNRALGRAGEEFVVGFEKRRLRRAGCGDLADKVRWVVDGDGYGYDVKSFETDGAERLLEIKTTCGNERTPFWMTKRECDVAAESRDIYRVRRVFHFRNEVKMFDIVPPLEARLLLTPTTFMAAPR
jgi:hypothetical protein